MENIISFNNVYANYSDGIALSDISFDINVGEMVFIMGPTGAGKSSVLRAIYKDLNISSGEITLNDDGSSLIVLGGETELNTINNCQK